MIVHFLILHGKITEWIPLYILPLLTSILNWMQNVDINLWPSIIILRNIVLKFCPQLTWNGSIFAITSFIWQEEFYFKETILNIWTTEWLCLQNLIHKKSNHNASHSPSHNASSRYLPMKHGENLGENFSWGCLKT